jgi:hypothetical protein
MAKKGLSVVDRTIKEEMKGELDTVNNLWYIPIKN